MLFETHTCGTSGIVNHLSTETIHKKSCFESVSHNAPGSNRAGNS